MDANRKTTILAQGSLKDTFCPIETCCFFNTNIKGVFHASGSLWHSPNKKTRTCPLKVSLEAEIVSLNFNTDGDKILTGSFDNTAKAWARAKGGLPVMRKNPRQHGSPCLEIFSLPEFMNFKLFVKSILVVNIKFGLFMGHPLSQ